MTDVIRLFADGNIIMFIISFMAVLFASILIIILPFVLACRVIDKIWNW